jgi:hypothetical protein
MYGQPYADLEITPPRVAWQMLRSLRSAPPGGAKKGDRKATFNAALEQAEQFFTAATDVGAATRPVLIFYGLAQAGWAVAAADGATPGNRWRLPGGHGITTDPVQNTVNGRLSDFALRDDGCGSFTKLADVLSAASLPKPTPLGHLWGMLATDQRFALPGMLDRRPLTVIAAGDANGAVVVIGSIPSQLLGTPDPGDGAFEQSKLWAEDRNRIIDYLAQYPSLAGCVSSLSSLPEGQPIGIYNRAEEFEIYVNVMPSATDVEPPTYRALVPPTIGYRGRRDYVFPRAGGSDKPAHPFLLWYEVIFGLSMLARYEPKGWAERISVDSSADAAPIEHLLDQALIVLPELIHRTILQVADHG